jgi:hypothetical protein
MDQFLVLILVELADRKAKQHNVYDMINSTVPV